MKRLFSLLLILALVVTFAACGTKTPDPTEPNTPATDTPASSSEDAPKQEMKVCLISTISSGVTVRMRMGKYPAWVKMRDNRCSNCFFIRTSFSRTKKAVSSRLACYFFCAGIFEKASAPTIITASPMMCPLH